jgi:hypothetical protein
MPPDSHSAHAGPMPTATAPTTDAPTRAVALADAARLFRASGNHVGAEATYRRALCVLREGLIPMDHEAQRVVRRGYAALLVELGRDRDAAELEREIVTNQPTTSKGRNP